MSGKIRKLAVLLAIEPVIPAAANQHAPTHGSTCAWERAREAAAARVQPPSKAKTTVTLADRLPAADGWFLGATRGSGGLNP